MKSREITLFLIGLSLFHLVQGQVNDTVHIEVVEVKGMRSKFSPGTKINTIEQSQINLTPFGELSEILKKNTSIYIKSYASGTSTISFRGASPNHTNVFFNGIGFNSYTLGHTNLSDVPMFFFDEISVQHGGASSLYGSGAIGGTIHLDSKPSWKKGMEVTIQQEVASFHTSFSGLKFRMGNGRLESSTKLFFKKSRNDFPFRNEMFKDFETGQYIRQVQKNSGYENHGILQELNFRLNNKNIVSAKYYRTFYWYEVQPTMSENLYGNSNAVMNNETERLIFQYSRNSHEKSILKFNSFYSKDFQLYYKEDNISSKTFSSVAEYEHRFASRVLTSFGIQYAYIVSDVHSYARVIEEHRADIFGSAVIEYIKNGKLSINLRNSGVSGFSPEFAPSLGISQFFRLDKSNSIIFSSSASRSYKIPTFNDRYWVPGGNPDLKPENGNNYEANLGFNHQNNEIFFKANVSIYTMKIDNWINWIPITPENWYALPYKKVHSRGVEFSTEYKLRKDEFEFELNFQYSFSKSNPIEIYNENDHELGKQLAYSPMHNAILNGELDVKNWRFSSNVSYTGERFNSTLDRILAGYFLCDIAVIRKIKLKDSEFDLIFVVNNILNHNYINIENYAMPGINWRFGIKYNFTKNKN